MAHFSVLPPEINSLRMYLGAGSAPMLQAAAAWDGLAAELGTAASSFSSVTTGLTGQAWQGPASAAMAAAAAPYAGFLTTASAQAQLAAGQAKAVASVFEAAKAAIVPPAAVAANREAFLALIRSNWLGLNAPWIAAVESLYEEYWAADVAAMTGYHAGASQAAAQLPLPAGLQQFLNTLPNLGIGNQGNANLGGGNTGSGNIGNGNKGSSNLGGGNIGNNNIGSGNRGSDNFGAGNVGTGNIGFGNQGPIDVNLLATPGQNNVGLGNIGNNNMGFGNTGDANTGGGNTGNGNIGGGNTGNNNFGFGNTGNNNIGIGLTGNNQMGI
ncbi:PPE family protein, partial [Mycobacterium tuberculosis]